MAITDDLRAIADASQRELDQVYDFFEHSKLVWNTFEDLVGQGHQVVFQSAVTGTAVDQTGLLDLASKYTREYLAAFTFRQFVSVFEVFLFDFLHRLLRHNPWQFGRTPLEFDVVLKAADRDAVISGVIAKRLNDLKYENVHEWFEALNRTVRLGCPTADEIASLAEIKAVRDILEHSAGVVNAIYLRKAGTKARYADGEAVEIDDTYHLESWRLIKKLVSERRRGRRRQARHGVIKRRSLTSCCRPRRPTSRRQTPPASAASQRRACSREPGRRCR